MSMEAVRVQQVVAKDGEVLVRGTAIPAVKRLNILKSLQITKKSLRRKL
jgi:hypothetical protein